MPRALGVMYSSPFPCAKIIDGAGSTVAMHKRAIVSGAAADLSTFITGGYPSWVTKGREALLVQQVGGVQLSVEASQVGGLMVTVDGTSTPSATLGLLVPVAPATLTLIGNLNDGIVKVFSTAGTVNVQCLFLP